MNAERSKYWTLETPRNPTEWQAFSMAEHAGIKLTLVQKDQYVEERLKMSNRESDQATLERLLRGRRAKQFRRSYLNIFPRESGELIHSSAQGRNSAQQMSSK